ALGLDARQQLVSVVLDPIDRDPGLFGELAVELIVRLIVPGRIDVDLRRQRRPCAAGEEGGGQGEGRWAYPDGHVASSVDAVLRMRKARICTIARPGHGASIFRSRVAAAYHVILLSVLIGWFMM